MLIYTDVSYGDPSLSKDIYVGLVVQEPGKVFAAALTILRQKGINPEDSAVLAAIEMFPRAYAYYTDMISTKYGTPVYRTHPMIELCHQLARAKRPAQSKYGSGANELFGTSE